jgi:hypothetical protein
MNIKFNKLYIQQIAYTDFYDGAQLFHWKTCESWCFLTFIVNLPPAYREIEVLEMICLWEAFFPDDQNSFQHHQIIDLVSSIPLHGSMLYAWSELLKNARKILLKQARKTPTGRYC